MTLAMVTNSGPTLALAVVTDCGLLADTGCGCSYWTVGSWPTLAPAVVPGTEGSCLTLALAVY